jgi:uncharacterized protein YkwD
MPATGRPETAPRSPHPIATSHSYLNPLPFNLRKPSLLLLAALAACLATSTAGGEGFATRLAVGDCLTGSDWGTPRQSLAPAVLSLVNAHRSALGLSQLRSSPTLTSSALWKARHMAKYGYFAHDDPAPPVARTAFDRIAACGYPGNEVGENIAVGYRTPAAVMQAWLQSPGHRANLEAPSWTVLGVGVAQSASGAVYWVQDFGTLDDSQTPANRTPIAHSDRRAVRRNHPLVIRVLGNDRDPDHDPLQVVRLVKRPHRGHVKVLSGGAVLYTPARNFVGRDRFRYEVSDGKGGYASAPVIVRVRR